MLTTLLVIFIVGYLAIALEHPIKIDKTASALLLGMVLWVVYALGAESVVPVVQKAGFEEFLIKNPHLQGTSLAHQSLEYILNIDIVEHLGDITQTLFFLIGAMTIVELVDVHGGFKVITDHITTRNKRKLLWIIACVTFILSAILDNLTTTIVMIMLLRKLIDDQHERWLYAGMIVIAANSGGAWSPIGDVTTIMLWVKGNITAGKLIEFVLAPSIISMIIPLFIVQLWLKGELAPATGDNDIEEVITPAERARFFYLGVGGLIAVPVFKTITHLPPFVGILLVLALLWIYSEIFYNTHPQIDKQKRYRLPRVISRIDMPSILFFFGILMAVAVLQSTGILHNIAQWLNDSVGNIFVINVILGVLSSIVDNVPLVAAAMGMYPVELGEVTGYAANFVVDGPFWALLSYCAGVGGSILIIGSAAGVIAMGLEKINFGWYLKRFSWVALLGYLAGAFTYLLEEVLFM